MSQTSKTDLALAQRVARGDERAFNEFFDTYFDAMYRFTVVRVDHDGDAAEEIVQAVLCKAIHKLHTYRGEAPLNAWLFTFCRHEMSSYLRDRGRSPRTWGGLDDLASVQAALDSLSEDDSAEGEARRKELVSLVRMALDRLPPKYGDALEWKYIEDVPVAEVARRMNVSEKSAESTLTRARNAFRDAFASVCGGRAELAP